MSAEQFSFIALTKKLSWILGGQEVEPEKALLCDSFAVLAEQLQIDVTF